MAEKPIKNKDSGKLIAITSLVVILVIAGVFIVAFDVFNIMPNGNDIIDTDTGPQKTTTYTGLSVEEAYNLINTTANLTIIETRDCDCKYNSGHIGSPPDFEAIHAPNWLDYNNTYVDLLVYDDNGAAESLIYCTELINQTFYGDIYYLIGGINAWTQAGYPSV